MCYVGAIPLLGEPFVSWACISHTLQAKAAHQSEAWVLAGRASSPGRGSMGAGTGGWACTVWAMVCRRVLAAG
jgi:hypothetical protein